MLDAINGDVDELVAGRRRFVRVGGSTRDKKPLSPTLARLAVGPGTKATFCPGPKGNRDKWPETKTYSVVVDPLANSQWNIPTNLEKLKIRVIYWTKIVHTILDIVKNSMIQNLSDITKH